MQQPLIDSVKSALGRMATLLILGLLLGQLSGCSAFRPAPLVLPAGFTANPQAVALANPQTRQAAYKALFPELKTLQAFGSLVAESLWRKAKDPLDFIYFSRNDAGQKEHLLRMRGFNALVPTVFDIEVRGRQALVVIYPPLGKVIFQGEIREGGSPFADRFGVEPWDLVPMLAIGNEIARNDFESDPGRWTTTLTPRQRAAEGMRQVVLDSRSGLPRRAAWRFGGKSYESEYAGWEFIKDPDTPVTRLMPTEVRIHRWGVTLKLTLSKYHYDKAPKETMFDVSVERLSHEQGYSILPLEQLKNVL